MHKSRRMSKASFVAGLLAGGAVSLLAVVAVPRLLPSKDGSSRPPAAGAAKAPPAASRAAALRRDANEIAAMATLRNIIAAQAHFQATALSDEDQDGVGEYGSFAELSGALGVRDGTILNPPVLSAAFRQVARGRVETCGYRFRIYLPQTGGQPVGEREKGGISPCEVDADAAERAWCCYAWPVEGDGRTFFTNQEGEILATSEGGYSGDRAPPPYAAFRSASGLTTPTAVGEENSRGADRWVWKPVG